MDNRYSCVPEVSYSPPKKGSDFHVDVDDNEQGRDRTTKCGSANQNQDTGSVSEEPQKVSLV